MTGEIIAAKNARQSARYQRKARPGKFGFRRAARTRRRARRDERHAHAGQPDLVLVAREHSAKTYRAPP